MRVDIFVWFLTLKKILWFSPLSMMFTLTLSYVAFIMLRFLGGAVVKNPPASAGDRRDTGSIPRSGRSPGVGNGNPLQYSCLENSMDRGAGWAVVHGVAKSQT